MTEYTYSKIPLKIGFIMSESKKPAKDPLIQAFSKRAAIESAAEAKYKIHNNQIKGKGASSAAVKLDDQDIVLTAPRSGYFTISDKISTTALEKKESNPSIPFVQSLKFSKNGVKTSVAGICNLRDYLKKYNIQPEDIRNIALQVLLGLKELHDQKRVHLDLKLDNIIVLSTQPFVVQIIDLPDHTLNDFNKVDPEKNIDYSQFCMVPDLLKDRQLDAFHPVNIDSSKIAENPIRYDIHTYHMFLQELLLYTGYLPPSVESCTSLKEKLKQIPGELPLFQQLFVTTHYDSNPSSLEPMMKARAWGSTELDRQKRISTQYTHYEKTMSKLERGYYSQDMDDPLQNAPEKIRDLVLAYEALKIQQTQLLENGMLTLADFPKTIKGFKQTSMDILDAINSIKADKKGTTYKSYKEEIDELSRKVSYSHDLEYFLSEAARLAEEFNDIQLRKNDPAIEKLKKRVNFLSDSKSDESHLRDKLHQFHGFGGNMESLEKRNAELKQKILDLISISKELLPKNLKIRCDTVLKFMLKQLQPSEQLKPIADKRSGPTDLVSFFASSKAREQILEMDEGQEEINSQKKSGLVVML